MKIISYNETNFTLVVAFPRDHSYEKIYEFFDIPKYIYDSLESSSYPQDYFNERIWNQGFEYNCNWNSIEHLLLYIGENALGFEPPVEVDTQRLDGDTPLHIACNWGDVSAVEILLEHGANPNTKGDMGCTPLYTTVSFGNLRCAKLILEAGADVNDNNEVSRDSSLDLAMIEGNERFGDLFKKSIKK